MTTKPAVLHRLDGTTENELCPSHVPEGLLKTFLVSGAEGSAMPDKWGHRLYRRVVRDGGTAHFDEVEAWSATTHAEASLKQIVCYRCKGTFDVMFSRALGSNMPSVKSIGWLCMEHYHEAVSVAV